jgi:hypothetical protein
MNIREIHSWHQASTSNGNRAAKAAMTRRQFLKTTAVAAGAAAR